MRHVLALLLLIATPAWAQARDFRIGGEGFSETDIIDARPLPDLSGQAVIMVTLGDTARERFAQLTTKLVGKEAPMVLDGRTLASPIVTEPITGGVIQISGSFTFQEAQALAKAISGKDPLPESLED